MTLTFDPTVCPEAVLPGALKIAKEAGFDAMVLHCIKTASSPFHPDASVRMIRDYFDQAGVTLVGLNIRDLTGLNDKGVSNLEACLRQVEWDIHLARSLRLKSANFLSGARTDESRDALISGVNTLLENITEVTLNIGNSTNTCLESIADFDSIFSELPDRAKIWLNSEQMTDAEQFIDSFVNRIGHVTINSNSTDIVRVLKTNGYKGPVVIDLENATGDPTELAQNARIQIEEIINANE